jgi:hypothetical protein
MGKAGYKDTSSARVDMSFGTTVPKIFGTEEDPKDPSKKMGSLTQVDIWCPLNGWSGLRVTIGKFIASHKKTLDKQIRAMYKPGSVATMFFQSMIQKTVVFWEAFATWVSSTEMMYDNLQPAGEAPDDHKKDVWNLMCFLIYSMFQEMSNRRAAGEAGAEDNPVEKCATILQGALAAHKFMDELINASFSKHPIFAATMAEFLMATKSSQVALMSHDRRLKKLEGELRGAQATADRAERQSKQNQKGVLKAT